MVCRKCGALLREDDVFCSQCGVFIPPSDKPVAATPDDNDSVFDLSVLREDSSPEPTEDATRVYTPVTEFTKPVTHTYAESAPDLFAPPPPPPPMAPEKVPYVHKPKSNKGFIVSISIISGLLVIALVLVLLYLFVFSGNSGDKYFKNGEYKKAAEAYEQILESDSENTDVRINLAKSYVELKEYDKAIDVLDQALEYEKDNPDVYAVIIKACGCAKEHDKANDYYKIAVKNDVSVDLADCGYVAVPDVVDMPLEDAQDIDGIEVFEEDSQDSEKEKDTILSQDPPGGSIAYDNGKVITVYVTVSDGPEEITVENYKNETLEEVEDDLGDDYTIAVKFEPSSKVDKGHIIRTTPSAGESLKRGGTITVYVSSGIELVTVPKLSGKSLDDARDILEDAGLEVGNITYKSNSKPYGTVIDSSPKATSRVESGTKIDLTVTSGE